MSDELRAGRRAQPFAAVPHWVLLAGITPQAVNLYALLLAHVNEQRGDGRAWPGMRTLGDLMGLKDRKSVRRYVQELRTLGALDVAERRVRRDGGRANIYTVHETPPPNHAGPTSLHAFYSGRADEARRARADTASAGDCQVGTGSLPSPGSQGLASEGWGTTDPHPWGRTVPMNKTKANETNFSSSESHHETGGSRDETREASAAAPLVVAVAPTSRGRAGHPDDVVTVLRSTPSGLSARMALRGAPWPVAS